MRTGRGGVFRENRVFPADNLCAWLVSPRNDEMFAVIVRMSAISIIMMEVVLSAYVLITFGCEMMHYDVLHRKLLSFCCKRQKINGFAEMLDNIYIYIIEYKKRRECAVYYIFLVTVKSPGA